jgi:tetratricopeptide (TPR) repeat protein
MAEGVDVATIEFLTFNLLRPLWEACGVSAGVDLEAVGDMDDLRAALSSDYCVAALLHRLRSALSNGTSWVVRPRTTPENMTIVASTKAVKCVVADLGVQPDGDMNPPVRDVPTHALATVTAGAITAFLTREQHPLSVWRGCQQVTCRAVDGVLELLFPGSLHDLKAALAPSDLLSKLDMFVLSRLSAYALGRSDAGCAWPREFKVPACGALYTVPVEWSTDDVALAVGDFASCVNDAGDTSVQLSTWRVPRRVSKNACRFASSRGVNVLQDDVDRAIRDGVAAAMNLFLGREDVARRVSLASQLCVIPSSSAADTLVVGFIGDGVALVTALDAAIRPESMSECEERSLQDSAKLFSVLHAALLKLQLPLAKYVRERLPRFFEECCADSRARAGETPMGRDPTSDDAAHIANAVYRVAGLPGNPLEFDGRTSDRKEWRPFDLVLSGDRRVVAVSEHAPDRVLVVDVPVSPPPVAVPVSHDVDIVPLSSFTLDTDKKLIGEVMHELRAVLLSGGRSVVSFDARSIDVRAFAVKVRPQTGKDPGRKHWPACAAAVVVPVVMPPPSDFGRAIFTSFGFSAAEEEAVIEVDRRHDKVLPLERGGRVMFCQKRKGLMMVTFSEVVGSIVPRHVSDVSDRKEIDKLAQMLKNLKLDSSPYRDRCVVGVDDIDGGHLWLAPAPPPAVSESSARCDLVSFDAAVAVAVNDGSLTAKDKSDVEKAVKLLRNRGVSIVIPALGSCTWLRPPLRRDDKRSGLRFRHLNGNSDRSYRDGDYDYRVNGWLDATKLFLPDSSTSYVSEDVYTWEMTNLIGAMERNAWLRGVSISAESLRFVRVSVRNKVAHPTRITAVECDECMDYLQALARSCGDAEVSDQIALMRISPRSFCAEKPPRPSFVHSDPQAGEEFIGRDDILRDLMQHIGIGARAGAGDESESGGISSTAGVTVIAGLDGVGKTALARQLCRRLCEIESKRVHRGVFWLSDSEHCIDSLRDGYSNIDSLREGYSNMAKELLLPVDPAARAESARDAVFRWMKLCDCWVLVLDGADNLESKAMSKFLPPKDARGHVVIILRDGTSGRLKNLGVRVASVGKAIRLTCLDVETSMTLLYQLCGCSAESLGDDERDAARELCDKFLGGLPRAIKDAAGAYRRSGGGGFVNLLRDYRHQYQRLASAGAVSDMMWSSVSVVYRFSGWQHWLRSSNVTKKTVDELGKAVQSFDKFRSMILVQSRADLVSTLGGHVHDAGIEKLWAVLSRTFVCPVRLQREPHAWHVVWQHIVYSLSAADVLMMWLFSALAADDKDSVPVDVIESCASSLQQWWASVNPRDEHEKSDVRVFATVEQLHKLSDLSLVSFERSEAAELPSEVSVNRALMAVVWESSRSRASAAARRGVLSACLKCLKTRLAPLVTDAGSVSDGGVAVMESWLPHAEAVTERATAMFFGSDKFPAELSRLTIDLVRITAAGFERSKKYHRAHDLYLDSLRLLKLQGAARVTVTGNEVASVITKLDRVCKVIRCGKVHFPVTKEEPTLPIGQLEVPGTTIEEAKRSLKEARSLHKEQKLPEALQRFRESLSLHLDAFGSDPGHPEVVATLRGLAITLHKVGDLTASEQRYHQALAMCRRLNYGSRGHRDDESDGLFVASMESALAKVLHAQGNLSESVRWYRSALSALAVGLPRPRALSLRGLAGVLRDQNRLDESVRLYREALAICRDVRTADLKGKTEIGECLIELASVLCDRDDIGDLAEATCLAQESLGILEQMHGVYAHWDVARSQRCLAVALFARGCLVGAADHHRQALFLFRRLLGGHSDHQDIALSLRDQATVLHAQGDLGEAERLHRDALAMFQRLHGTDKGHRDVALSHRGLAVVLHAQGRLVEAEDAHGRALEMLRELQRVDAAADVDVASSLRSVADEFEAKGCLSASSHKTSLVLLQRLQQRAEPPAISYRDEAESLRGLAAVLHAKGDLTGAAMLFRESLAILWQLYGRYGKHVDIAASLRGLADVLCDQDELEEAELLHRQSLEMFRRVRGETFPHPDVVASLRGLATVLHAQHDLTESARLYREALDMCRQLYGHGAEDPEHPDVAASMRSLAAVLQDQGNLEEAEDLFRQALEMSNHLYGARADRPDIAALVRGPADVLQAQGKAEALHWQRRYQVMTTRLLGRDVPPCEVAESLRVQADEVDRAGRDAPTHSRSLAVLRRVLDLHAHHYDVDVRASLADVLGVEGAP